MGRQPSGARAVEPLAEGIAQCAASSGPRQGGFHRSSRAHCRRRPCGNPAGLPHLRAGHCNLAGARLRKASGSRVARNRSGFDYSSRCWVEPLLSFRPRSAGLVLTHAEAVAGWGAARAIATYHHSPVNGRPSGAGGRRPHRPRTPRSASGTAGRSSIAGAGAAGQLGQHACGPGKTHAHLRRARVRICACFPRSCSTGLSRGCAHERQCRERGIERGADAARALGGFAAALWLCCSWFWSSVGRCHRAPGGTDRSARGTQRQRR